MPAKVSCACALVREAERDVAGHCRPFDRRPHTPDWPAPRNPVIAPITVLLGHANDQLLDFSLDPRPTGASRGFRAIEFAGGASLTAARTAGRRLRPLFGQAADKGHGIAPSLAGRACAIVVNALERLLGAELAYRCRQRSIGEVDGRPLDNGSGLVDDEAKRRLLWKNVSR